MKKAIIIVQNKNKMTKRFSEEIAEFLLLRGLSAELIPIGSFEPEKLEGADYLLLSGWKNGSMLSFTKPDNEWENFVKSLPTLNGIKTALFTTYHFFSGMILKKMKKYLGAKTENLEFAIASRNGSLTVADKMTLNEFIR
jgi:hypothetical protein